MKSIIAFLITVFFVFSVSALNPLRGQLYDYKNKPIKSAKIYMRGSKDYVKTDKEGRFFLDNVDPADTIYIKWRGQFYDVPVDSCLGMSIKFDREPINTEYIEAGIMGTISVRNFNSRIQRYIPVTTATQILKKEAWKNDKKAKDAALEAVPFRGRLFDYRSKPIKNAKVYTSDPDNYVKTDKEGKFLLYDVLPDDTVFVKWKGEIYDIPVDSGRGMSVKFGKDYPKRYDVVNTGAGMVDARYYNGPRAVRTAKELEMMGSQNIVFAMQGMKGVTLSPPNKPNESYKVYVRNGSPLWILDGIRMPDMPDITVSEIERIEVLHDGGMYGLGAMGGVVVITTKGSNL